MTVTWSGGDFRRSTGAAAVAGRDVSDLLSR